MAIPTHSPYVIIGAGIHGLSTAYHLALQLKAAGKGDGRDIIILDKSGICSGATGIACGVIRNNYFQPAMRELMAHSVNIWESDPETYSYHPVGTCRSAANPCVRMWQPFMRSNRRLATSLFSLKALQRVRAI